MDARTADLVLGSGLFVFALATRWAFAYHGGMGDPDSMAIAAGVAQGLAARVPMAEAVPYGRQISPGTYLLAHALAPLLRGHPERVVGWLNALGIVCASLVAPASYALARRWLGRVPATCCVVLLLTSPLVWESGTYYHPIIASTLLLLCAVVAFQRATRGTLSIAGVGLCAVLACCAVLARAEVLLIVPALCVATLASRQPRRNLAALAAVLLCAAAVFVLAERALAPPELAPASSLAQYVRDFAVSYFRPRAIVRNGVWVPLSVGVGSCVLAVVGLMRWRTRPLVTATSDEGGRGAARLSAALLWAGVPLLFWLPNPVPLMRHFMLVVPALLWIAGVALLSRLPTRTAVLLASGVVVANLMLPELVYLEAPGHRAERARWPHGTFFSNHTEMLRQVDRYARLQDALERTAEGLATSTAKNAVSAGGSPAPLVLVEAPWAAYGTVLYWLATQTPPWRSTTCAPPDVPLLSCWSREGCTLLLLSTGYDLDRASCEAALERARRADGPCLISRETAKRLDPLLLGDVRVTLY